jgi:hypothetical protein
MSSPAAFALSRRQHEMFDDQLAALIKKIGECLLALRPVEDVLLLYLGPRKIAAFGAQLIAQPGEVFLLC